MRKAISILLLVFVGSSAWSEDLKDGSDPSGVIKYFQPYADKGNVNAQLTLGSTYYSGKFVPQDYTKAVKWFRLAAQQGDATAENFLGLMYLNGQGVPENLLLAHMWSNLAAASGKEVMILKRDDLTQMRDKLASQMTPQQVAEAQKMAQDCLAKNLKGCD
jgi:TPR repeat protein